MPKAFIAAPYNKKSITNYEYSKNLNAIAQIMGTTISKRIYSLLGAFGDLYQLGQMFLLSSIEFVDVFLPAVGRVS